MVRSKCAKINEIERDALIKLSQLKIFQHYNNKIKKQFLLVLLHQIILSFNHFLWIHSCTTSLDHACHHSKVVKIHLHVSHLTSFVSTYKRVKYVPNIKPPYSPCVKKPLWRIRKLRSPSLRCKRKASWKRRRVQGRTIWCRPLLRRNNAPCWRRWIWKKLVALIKKTLVKGWAHCFPLSDFEHCFSTGYNKSWNCLTFLKL